MAGNKIVGWLAAIWGAGGVCALLGYAILSLSSHAGEAFDYSWRISHWLGLLAVVAFMAYYEGYRGFQQGFSPRVAARARVLMHNPEQWHLVLLAPAFCASYIYATPRRRLVVVLLTTMIVSLVFLVRTLPQPWRGIVDIGVIVGLAWGVISIVLLSLRALTQDDFEVSPELPDKLQSLSVTSTS